MNIGQVDHGGRVHQQVRAGTNFLSQLASESGNENDLVTNRLAYCIQKDEIVMSVGSNYSHIGLKWSKNQAYPLVTSTLANCDDRVINFMLYMIHTPKYLYPSHIESMITYISNSGTNDHEKIKAQLRITPDMRPIGISVGNAEASGEVGDTVCTAQVGGTRSTLAVGPWEINTNDLVSVYFEGVEEKLYDERGRSHQLIEKFWDCYVYVDENKNKPNYSDDADRIKEWANNRNISENDTVIVEMNDGPENKKLFIFNMADAARKHPFCPNKWATFCRAGCTSTIDDPAMTLLLNGRTHGNANVTNHQRLIKQYHDKGRFGMNRSNAKTDKKRMFAIKPYYDLSEFTASFGDRQRIIGRAISSSKPHTQSDILLSRTLI